MEEAVGRAIVGVMDSARRFARGGLPLLVTGALLIAGCSAHYPVNSVESGRFEGAYDITNSEMGGRDERLILVLAFSGGGTRAAAFAYGVIEVLAATTIRVHGRERRLLDEVDVISSVSGGSFTAAYYGLFGDRIFEDFEKKFLRNDVQSMLQWRALNPVSWPKLASPYYSRSELAAELYDELLFENRTFRDILEERGPIVAINATDMSLGTQFTFSGTYFRIICSDLLDFPVSRAVAASSAVPVAFSSVVLENHAGACDHETPGWASETLKKRDAASRTYHAAVLVDAYSNAEEYPYIHLLDGGISDNLGVRPMIDALVLRKDTWGTLRERGRKHTNKIAIIVVNAQTPPSRSHAKNNRSTSPTDALSASILATLSRYSFETMDLLRYRMGEWEDKLVRRRCEALNAARKAGQKPPFETACADVRTYLVEVSFDRLDDEAERAYLNTLPTAFNLADEAVDRLRKAAAVLLENNDEFRRLVKDLNVDGH